MTAIMPTCNSRPSRTSIGRDSGPNRAPRAMPGLPRRSAPAPQAPLSGVLRLAVSIDYHQARTRKTYNPRLADGARRSAQKGDSDAKRCCLQPCPRSGASPGAERAGATLAEESEPGSGTQDGGGRRGCGECGWLILLERMDHAALTASVELAPGKARAAALFKKPAQALEDAINHGRYAAITARGFIEMQGGLPVVVEREVIVAIGASFATPDEDESRTCRAHTIAFSPAGYWCTRSRRCSMDSRRCCLRARLGYFLAPAAVLSRGRAAARDKDAHHRQQWRCGGGRAGTR